MTGSSRPCPPATPRRTFLRWGLACASAAYLGEPRLSHAAAPLAAPMPLDAYGLDEISRQVPRRGRVRCPDVELVTYRGRHLRYSPATRIYTGFQVRLERFEAIAREVGIAIYGRGPRSLQHLGTYNCRRISAYPEWISEHGLGNAIDVAGFTFGALDRSTAPPEGLPRALRGPFALGVKQHYSALRVKQHYDAKRGYAKHHALFLRTLAQKLIARSDIFRVLLGPGYPGHKDHFHFDCAPFRLIEGFDLK